MSKDDFLKALAADTSFENRIRNALMASLHSLAVSPRECEKRTHGSGTFLNSNSSGIVTTLLGVS